MSPYKRHNVWWIDITHGGKRIQCSTGTSDKVAAERLHDKVKEELWRVEHLQARPSYTWMNAVVR